mmetsp:Transcript_52526/g.83653  ORF Transcript_52526/g.83653 Transcript_52526/m.83653 type:complete len:84 (-) Transcript_52526:212-463(-)
MKRKNSSVIKRLLCFQSNIGCRSFRCISSGGFVCGLLIMLSVQNFTVSTVPVGRIVAASWQHICMDRYQLYILRSCARSCFNE